MRWSVPAALFVFVAACAGDLDHPERFTAAAATGAGGAATTPVTKTSDGQIVAASTPEGAMVYARCHGCHLDTGAGDIGPNITESTMHGIGNYTDDDIRNVMRSGTDPTGRMLCDLMTRYDPTRMTDADLDALIAYVRTLAAIEADAPMPSCGP